jgi:formate dehydrogenase subunit gamma
MVQKSNLGEEAVLHGYMTWDGQVARAVIDEKKAMPGALLPILHALQETFGYIDRASEQLIADALNISRAEVHGVITFYADFRMTPPASHELKLCRAEACQSMGGNRLGDRAVQRLGIGFGEATSDGRVSLEPVYCLGLCSVAPSAMLDGRIVGRLDDEKLDALLAEVER